MQRGVGGALTSTTSRSYALCVVAWVFLTYFLMVSASSESLSTTYNIVSWNQSKGDPRRATEAGRTAPRGALCGQGAGCHVTSLPRMG